MQKYYTADSANGLFENGVFEFCIVGLGDYTPKQPEQADFLNQMYPEGLSKHGYNYLYNPNIMMGNLTHASKALMIGLVFELVRRSHFPEKPSRYQSLFACQQVSEAKQFRELLADEKENDQIRKASIYEVITQRTVHRGDMELVKSDCPVLDLYRRAHLYWSGETVPYKDGGGTILGDTDPAACINWTTGTRITAYLQALYRDVAATFPIITVLFSPSAK